MVQQSQQKDYVARTCSLGGNRRAADAHREQVLFFSLLARALMLIESRYFCTSNASKLRKCYPCVTGAKVLAYSYKRRAPPSPAYA